LWCGRQPPASVMFSPKMQRPVRVNEVLHFLFFNSC
jgi:hypothetical protein